MLGIHRAAADVDGRAHDAIDFEQVERDRGTDDIGDRIGGAYFVEVDLLDGGLVDLGLGRAEFAENSDGVAAGGFGEVGAADQFLDVREVAMLLGLFGLDPKLGAGDAAALHLFEGYGGVDLERRDGIGDSVRIGSGIGESPDEHVAAESGEGV